jgi:uncharacterized membrane protein
VGFFLLLLVAVSSYTLYGIMATETSGKIDPSLATAIISLVGVVLPLAYYGLTVSLLDHSTFRMTGRGVLVSAIAGVAIAAFSISVIHVFSHGAPAYTFPLVYGGTIVLGAIVGWLVLDQRPNTLNAVGLVITAAGVGLVAVSNR